MQATEEPGSTLATVGQSSAQKKIIEITSFNTITVGQVWLYTNGTWYVAREV